MRGASTLTQQLVKNTFLTQERSPTRKFSEWIMSIALERRLSKDQVLELYLNDVWLGQRGSFAIHGVPEAARLFFGKDVQNVTLSEAATIAGVIQSPPRLSPFNNPERAKERRNVVLHAMVDTGFITSDAADRAVARAAADGRARARRRSAVLRRLHQPGAAGQVHGVATGAVDVYTTLDLHLQKIAQDAVREGLVRVDEILARRKRQRAQAALIAIDPRTGEILAFVGGRSYNQSQYNRAIAAKRQPGSVFKPFVYLAAFEHAYAEGRTDVTPATLVMDEPTTFAFNEQTWNPGNYDGEYEGAITLRRALALSRNIATIKVAEATGYDEVAALWRKVGAGTPPRPYPSIALGVFEATPFEIASAYTIFPNGGTIRPLRADPAARHGGGTEIDVPWSPAKTIARQDTTYLVTNMMRSVLNEGTGAGARAAGFTLDAAGKSGTTNDLRDAWFVGFTPELLTVVWVGLDDNQPLGLSGTQAALPIWTTFMMRALAGPAQPALRGPRGHRLRRHRPGHRKAGDRRLPADLPRGLHRRHRTDRDLRAAHLLIERVRIRSSRSSKVLDPFEDQCFDPTIRISSDRRPDVERARAASRPRRPPRAPAARLPAPAAGARPPAAGRPAAATQTGARAAPRGARARQRRGGHEGRLRPPDQEHGAQRQPAGPGRPARRDPAPGARPARDLHGAVAGSTKPGT